MAVVRLILVSSLHVALFLTIAHIHIILFTILLMMMIRYLSGWRREMLGGRKDGKGSVRQDKKERNKERKKEHSQVYIH